MNITDAQQDMRTAYLGGATGVFASGLIWLVAAVVACFKPPMQSITVMYVGGMFIFPLSIIFSKLLGKSGQHSSHNPLAHLAVESTVIMLVCLPLAFVAFLFRTEWFYPALLLIIGGRYFLFSTLYGLKIYWLMAASLVLAAIFLVCFKIDFAIGAFTGASIEMLFSVAIFFTVRHLS